MTEEEIAYAMRRKKKIGDTPLHFAVKHGDCAAELVHYMLAKKARATDVSAAGWTPKAYVQQQGFSALDVTESARPCSYSPS